MNAQLLDAPAATARRETRTVVPGDAGRPGLVSVVRPFTAEEQARHEAAFNRAEAHREEILEQAREQFVRQG